MKTNLLLLSLLLSAASANANTCTSAVSGASGTAATWSGCGGVTPTIGDTVVIGAHAITWNADAIVGLSGATGTVAITVGAGGSLTVNPGVTLTVRGDLNSNRGSTTTIAGTLILDASTGVNYMWTSTVVGTGSAVMLVTGTPGSYAVVKKGTRGGTAQILAGETSAKFYGDILLTYGRFEGLGSTTLVAVSGYSGTVGARFSADHTIWKDCGQIYGRITSGAQLLNWNYTTIIDPVFTGTDLLLLAFAANTTGSRSFTNLYVWNSSTTYAHIDIGAVWGTGPVSNIYLYRSTMSVAHNNSRDTSYSGLFVMADVDGPSQLFSLADDNNQLVRESIGFTHMNNPKVFQATSPGVDYGDNTVTGTVLDGDRYVVNDWGDGMGTIHTYNIIIGSGSNIITVNERTTLSDTIRVNSYHNTGYQAYANNFCESFCKPNTLQNYKSNLMVDMYGSSVSASIPALNVARGFWQTGAMIPQNVANIDFNVWYQPSPANTLKPDNLVHPVHGLSYMGGATLQPYWADGSTYGTVANRGLNDFKADPQFFDSSRTLRKWVGVVLGVDTTGYTFRQLAAEIFKQSGWTSTGVETTPLGLSTTAGLAYIRAGFAPRNTALRGTAHEGGDIGAVPVIGIKNSLGATLAGGNTIF